MIQQECQPSQSTGFIVLMLVSILASSPSANCEDQSENDKSAKETATQTETTTQTETEPPTESEETEELPVAEIERRRLYEVAPVSGDYPGESYYRGQNGPPLDVRSFTEDQFGRIYAAGPAGLARFEGDKWTFLVSGTCTAPCFDGDSRIYAFFQGELGWWKVDETSMSEFVPLTDKWDEASRHLSETDRFRPGSDTWSTLIKRGTVYFWSAQSLLRIENSPTGLETITTWGASEVPEFKFCHLQQWNDRVIICLMGQDKDGRWRPNRIAEITEDDKFLLSEDLRFPAETQWKSINNYGVGADSEARPYFTGPIRGVSIIPGKDGSERLVICCPERIVTVEAFDNPIVTDLSFPDDKWIHNRAVTTLPKGFAIATARHGILFFNSAGEVQVQMNRDLYSAVSQLKCDSHGRVWGTKTDTVHRIDFSTGIVKWDLPQMPSLRDMVYFEGHLVTAHEEGIGLAVSNSARLPAKQFRNHPAWQGPGVIRSVNQLEVIGGELFLSRQTDLVSTNSLGEDFGQKIAGSSLPTCLAVLPTHRPDTAVTIRWGSRPTLLRKTPRNTWGEDRETPLDTGSFARRGAFSHNNFVWMSAEDPGEPLLIYRINTENWHVDHWECPVTRPFLFHCEDRVFLAGREPEFPGDPPMFYEFHEAGGGFEVTDEFTELEALLNAGGKTDTLEWAEPLPDGGLLFVFTASHMIKATPTADGGWKYVSVMGNVPNDSGKAGYVDGDNYWLIAGQTLYCKSGAQTSGDSASEVPQKIVLNSVTLAGNPQQLTTDSTTGDLQFGFTNETLRFDYAIPSAASAEKSLYRHRLVGQQSEWSEWSMDSSIEFAALREGSYTLELQGLLNQQTLTPVRQITIAVAPPWWRTNWFRALVAVAMVAMGAVVTRLYYRRHVRQNAVLREEIEEREQAEKRLAETQEQLLERERLKALGEMAAGVAHDVNNTLMPLVAYSEQLAKGDPAPNMLQKYGNAILEGVMDASDIIRRIQPLYREETKRLAPEDIDQIVESVADNARQIALTKHGDKQIKILTDTTPVIATVNAADIREVLLNLVYNAMDAIEDEGEVTICCDRSEDDLVLQVRDNGMGMTAKVKDACLKSFFTTKQETGTGLGLSISQAIVTSYEGRIKIDSTPDVGTKFQITLPLERSPFHQDDRIPDAEPAIDEPSYRILVVDDVRKTRLAIRQQLEHLNHTVVDVSSGEEALECLRSSEFDLLMTDYAMPGMDGLELYRQLVSTSFSGPVIFVTSSEKPEILNVCDDLLLKPTTINRFQESIRKVTKRRSLKLKQPIAG